MQINGSYLLIFPIFSPTFNYLRFSVYVFFRKLYTESRVARDGVSLSTVLLIQYCNMHTLNKSSFFLNVYNAYIAHKNKYNNTIINKIDETEKNNLNSYQNEKQNICELTSNPPAFPPIISSKIKRWRILRSATNFSSSSGIFRINFTWFFFKD